MRKKIEAEVMIIYLEMIYEENPNLDIAEEDQTKTMTNGERKAFGCLHWCYDSMKRGSGAWANDSFMEERNRTI